MKHNDNNKEPDANEIFGKLVKKYREAEGLSQASLAFDVKCSVTYLSEIENGKANVTFNIGERLSARLRLNFKGALNTMKRMDDTSTQ